MDNYDLKYSKKEFYWGIKPHELIIKTAKQLSLHTKILDLGCGEGKDSFYLAKKKFDVTSTDISKAGIEKLENFAKDKNLKIKTKVSNAKNFLKKCDNFDAIVCLNVLQFIDKENIVSIIENMKAKTNQNGINIIASFVAESKRQKSAALEKGKYLFAKGELKELYKDWKITFYKEKVGKWETHGCPKHRHFKVTMIAQKI